jgi:hypothetical protein
MNERDLIRIGWLLWDAATPNRREWHTVIGAGSGVRSSQVPAADTLEASIALR